MKNVAGLLLILGALSFQACTLSVIQKDIQRRHQGIGHF